MTRIARLSLLVGMAMAALAGPAIGSAAAASPATPAATRSCSESDRFIQAVKAVNLNCRIAVAIAFAHARRASCFAREGDFIFDRATPCTVTVSRKSFRCTPRKAEGGITVKCVRLGTSVRWFNSGG